MLKVKLKQNTDIRDVADSVVAVRTSSRRKVKRTRRSAEHAQRAELAKLTEVNAALERKTIDSILQDLRAKHKKANVACMLAEPDSDARFLAETVEMALMGQVLLLSNFIDFQENVALTSAAHHGQLPTQERYNYLSNLQDVMMDISYDLYERTNEYTLEANEEHFHGVNSLDYTDYQQAEQAWYNSQEGRIFLAQ